MTHPCTMNTDNFLFGFVVLGYAISCARFVLYTCWRSTIPAPSTMSLFLCFLTFSYSLRACHISSCQQRPMDATCSTIVIRRRGMVHALGLGWGKIRNQIHKSTGEACMPLTSYSQLCIGLITSEDRSTLLVSYRCNYSLGTHRVGTVKLHQHMQRHAAMEGIPECWTSLP